MNDLCLHEEYALSHLKDRTAARALVDHHQEALGVTRQIALRAVATMRRARQKANDLGKACYLLRPASKWAALLTLSIRLHFEDPEAMSSRVILVLGRRQPTACVGQEFSNQLWFDPPTIIVGAKWVLRAKATFQADMRANRMTINDMLIEIAGI